MKFRYDKENEELVVSDATRIEYHQMNLWLTRKVKGWKFQPTVKLGIWDGSVNFFRNGKINLGLWKEAMNGCKEIEVPFIVENKEDFPINRDVTLEKVQNFCKEFFKEHKVKTKEGAWVPFMPYDHQIETAYKILKNRFCLAEVATSGGKSLIISIVYFYTLKYIDANAKLLAIVPNITLVSQLYDNVLEYYYGENNLQDKSNIGNDIRIEEVMSDRPRKFSGTDNPNIYIGTYQSLEKWPKDFFKQFHTVVVDESHQAKAKTITTILESTFKHAYSRYGVSGTFPTEETCEILNIQSVLGPKITEVSADELKKKGIITPMEIKSIIMNHNKPEIAERLKLVRKSGDGKAAFDFEKRFIHQSEERLDFIKKIVAKFTKNSLLLFNTIENGQKIFNDLKELFPDKDFYYIDGTISGKKREAIKKEMGDTSGKPKILVASFGTLATGVSINAIFNIVFLDSFKSEQIVIQSIGRGLRLHSEKDKVIIFDLVDVFDPNDMTNILFKHYLERRGFYIKRKYPFKEIKINL
jgi:superfamily II DNA or RNA helicase